MDEGVDGGARHLIIMDTYRAMSPGGLLSDHVHVTGGLGPPSPIWANVASIGPIPSLKKGDHLLVGVDVEVTQASDVTHATAITSQVICGESVGHPGQYVVRAATTNDTPGVHHLVVSRTTLFVVTVSTYNYLTLMIAADADAAAQDETVRFENLDGQVLMWVMHLRR